MATIETTNQDVPPAPVRSGQWRAAIAGALAALAALATGELISGLVEGAPSLVDAVGTWVIDSVPEPVKQFAIDVFGTNDKLALLIGIVVVAALIGAGVGILAARRFAWAIGAFIGFGAIGALAGLRVPDAAPLPVWIAAAVSAAVGLAVLSALLRMATRADADPDRGRRAFLLGAGSVLGLAALAAAGGRLLLQNARRMLASREDVVLPAAGEPAAPPPAAASLEVTGLSPLVTPNETFYRIDTAFLNVPQVNLTDWRLRFTGMVDRPLELDFQALLDLPMVERHITLACVSNEVGGDLVGNALWLGVPLPTLLERAGVQAGATQVVGRSVDAFTVGFPTAVARDGRDALVAVGMNGEPLPIEHGFPARLVVAGLYGYVSATKWLTEVELTTWESFDAYWVPRGWSKEAPIKTQSRIDVPRNGSSIPPGPATVAGVAWAPTRGISRVEVRIDGAEWQEAELAEQLADTTWRQWSLPWEATDGIHTVMVRATDGTGETQTEEVAPPAPDGATGYHSIVVAVE